MDLSKYTALQIASAFGVPPSYLNNLEKASFASVSAMQDELFRDTLLPILKQYETEMSCKLFTQSEKDKNFYFYYNCDELLRADLQTRANAYAQLIDTVYLLQMKLGIRKI